MEPITTLTQRPAADLALPDARLRCTVGTVGREIEAVAPLAGAGWQIAVRADFDVARLQHVHALLHGVAGARPWRMGSGDYLASLAETPVASSARPWTTTFTGVSQFLAPHRSVRRRQNSPGPVARTAWGRAVMPVRRPVGAGPARQVRRCGAGGR
ncbi:DUF2399 domain-containing protein [Micromonospora sp. MS34]|uniref:DUF2399 domain-containing protein n=1 Tax=Micromonospora sp. MS34 TaxID=3385971 RepID=UPI0039A07A13